MNAAALVRKAQRSVDNSITQLDRLMVEREMFADLECAGYLDCELKRFSRHVERRLKHHTANITALQTFASLDHEQAEGLIAWLDSARAERRQSRDDDLDALLARLSETSPAAAVRRPTRYESILQRLGFGKGAAA